MSNFGIVKKVILWLLWVSPCVIAAQVQKRANLDAMEERDLKVKATKAPSTTKATKASKIGSTLSPTVSPSWTPSQSPSSCYEESDVTPLLSILSETPSDICLMLTDGTPQNLAYEFVRDDGYLNVISSAAAEWYQRFALAVLFYSIPNADTALTDWMNPSTDECTWTAAICDSDSDGSIFQLDLDDRELDGTIPAEFQALTSLRFLKLTNNTSLVANSLEVLPSLDALKELQLDRNGLLEIPSIFGDFQALSKLNLGLNQLTSLPSELGNLDTMRSLMLHDNDIQILPTELGQLTALTYLNLRSNDLPTIPSEFGNLGVLTSLVLTGNQLTSLPTEIGTMFYLKSLYLPENQLTSLPSELGDLSNHLKYMYLQSNQLSSLPTELGNLSALQYLFLHDNALTILPSELGTLSSLERLVLSNNTLVTPLPSEICALSSQLTTFEADCGTMAECCT